MGSSVNALGALAVTYLDRMASGDATRGSIVLSKFAEVWPDLRVSFASEIGQSVSALPTAIPSVWDGSTREIVRFVLPTGSSATVRALADQIGQTQIASQLRDRAKVYLEYIPTTNPARAFAARVAEADIGSLPQTLDALISGVIAGAAVPTGSSAQRFNPRAVQAFRVPSMQQSVRAALSNAGVPQGPGSSFYDGGTPTMLEPMTITGQSRVLGIPTWGWVVGGSVLAIGLGVFAYRKWGRST